MTNPARRYLRALKRPNLQAWYGWYDPRSWSIANGIRGRIQPSRADVRDARTILRRGRAGGRFIATLPRSGSHVLVSLLDSAHALQRGEDGDYDYVTDLRLSGDPAWMPRGQVLCWPAATASLVQLAKYFHQSKPLPDQPVMYGHHPMSVGTIAVDTDPGRPVVLVRHPKAAMRSSVRKRGLTSMEADRKTATSVAGQYADWFAVWSRALEADTTGRILLVHYEDLIEDTAGELRRISEHWGLGLGDAAIDGAIELCARDRMEVKTGNDETNVRVSIGEGAPVEPALLDLMDGILDERITDALGYDLADRSSRAPRRS